MIAAIIMLVVIESSLMIRASSREPEENTTAVCIVSGGKGDSENISEAEAMYRWLVDKGIDSSRIYKEDKSTSTVENIDK